MGRRRTSVLCVLSTVGLLAAACGQSGDRQSELAGAVPPDTAPANDASSSDSAPIEGNELGRTRGGQVPLDGTRPDGGVFYVEGNTVHVNFPGPRIGNIEEDGCAGQYEIEANETNSEVAVSVFSLRARNPPKDPICNAAQWFVTMNVELDAPLGNRALVTAGQAVNPALVDDRLAPTWIPEDWPAADRALDPIFGGYQSYGSQVMLAVKAMADKPGVDIVRGNPNHVNIDVLGTNDGAVVTRTSTGVHRLGFDHAGWFYDIVAEPSVDRDELIKFARSFARAPEARPVTFDAFENNSDGVSLDLLLDACGVSDLDIKVIETAEAITVEIVETFTAPIKVSDEEEFMEACQDIIRIELENPYAGQQVIDGATGRAAAEE